MKRLTFILLLMSFFTANVVVYANPDMVDNRRNIILSKSRSLKEIKPKSLFISPIESYIENGQLFASFLVDMNVSVSIVSLEDNSVIYSADYAATTSSTLSIDLSDLESGRYEISFIYNNTVLTGEFVL